MYNNLYYIYCLIYVSIFLFIILCTLCVLYYIIIYNNNNNSFITDANKIKELCLRINDKPLDDTLNKVYILTNVLSLEECAHIIKESENYASEYSWKKDRHDYYPTTDNEIRDIPELTYIIENRVYSKLIPFYKSYYNIPSDVLGIDETFVVKYSIGGQQYLEQHTDGCDFSFVITLNNDFKGGGTYFVNLEKQVNAPIGSAVIFCSKNKHMGVEITEGTRYILTGFLSLKKKKYCDEVIE